MPQARLGLMEQRAAEAERMLTDSRALASHQREQIDVLTAKVPDIAFLEIISSDHSSGECAAG
jgi:hypothetical protein